MNNKRIKKVKKILKNQFKDILTNTQNLPFFERLNVCYLIIFKINLHNLSVIKKD
jgi:hypothetical protein